MFNNLNFFEILNKLSWNIILIYKIIFLIYKINVLN